jgi:cytochrome o ubiquinol oxidase operon protein cyoD
MNTSTLRSYITGFTLSLVFTLLAFGLVWVHMISQHQSLPHGLLVPALVVLGVAQLLVQLIFFLHVGNESKPRWNLTVLIFALLTVFIIVGGTLWIMQNLQHTAQMQDMFTGEVAPQNQVD